MEFWLNLSALIEKYCYLMSALQLRISLSLMRLCPCDPGEGVRGCPWFGMEAEVGVKVFRVHQGKEGPQRLGLITSVKREKTGAFLLIMWTKRCPKDFTNIYWSAIPLNNSLFNPPPHKTLTISLLFFPLFRVLGLCLLMHDWIIIYIIIIKKTL